MVRHGNRDRSATQSAAVTGCMLFLPFCDNMEAAFLRLCLDHRTGPAIHPWGRLHIRAHVIIIIIIIIKRACRPSSQNLAQH